MTKFNYMLLGLAGLALASCSQDDLVGPAQGDGNFNVTVKLPEDLATRAVNMNTGLTADRLQFAVYDAADGQYVTSGETTFGNSLQTVVSFNLATGKSYYISFFATDPNTNVYTFNATDKIMTVNYDGMDSQGTEEDDSYDCFINLLDTQEIGSTTVNTSITLYRPIAQINWGTNDLTEPAVASAYGDNGQYIRSTLTTKAYTTFSLLDNDVVTDENSSLIPAGSSYMTDVEFENFTQPQNAADAVPAFPVAGYEYVAMQYLLAPGASSAVYDLDLAISNSGRTDGAEVVTNVVNVATAPVQANYRTNIYGNLLTDNVEITVDKDPNWDIPDYNFELIDGVLYTVIGSEDAKNLYNKTGNFILSGDVSYPGSAFVFTKDININLNGHTLTSDGTSSGLGIQIQGSNNADVRISNGTILPAASAEAITNGSATTINIVGDNVPNVLTLNDVNLVGSVYGITVTGHASQAVINSGNFTWSEQWPESDLESKLVCVYVNGNGTALINGGTFGMPGVHSDYILNVADQYRAGSTNSLNPRQPNEAIIVRGGTFINFDPSNNKAEGDPTNFVADGYTVVSSQVGEDIYYTVVPASTTTTVASQAELQAAVGTPNTTIVMNGGSYTYPNKVAAGVTFIGTNGAAFNMGSSQQANYTDVTFKNLKFVSSNVNYAGLQHSKNLTYENCEIEGLIWLYAEGISFNNCKFTQPLANNYNVWTYTASPATFTNCTFSCAGKSVLIYNELTTQKTYYDYTFENCTFTASQPANDGKAAIEIGNGNSFVVNINNCTAEGFDNGSLSGNSLWNHKVTDNAVRVFVNGEEVYYNK